MQSIMWKMLYDLAYFEKRTGAASGWWQALAARGATLLYSAMEEDVEACWEMHVATQYADAELNGYFWGVIQGF